MQCIRRCINSPLRPQATQAPDHQLLVEAARSHLQIAYNYIQVIITA
jgi:hypothetical protein